MKALELVLLSYLINALWQVPLIFAAAWLAARLAARIARGTGPLLEHRIWTSALILQVALPACPPIPVRTLSAICIFFIGLFHNAVAAAPTQITITTTAKDLNYSPFHLPAHLLFGIASLYICVLFYFAARLTYSLFKTHQLRHSSRPITLNADTLGTWQRLSSIFRVFNAHIAVSARISAPSTIGIRNRLILLPSAMPATLLQQDMDAALAHEFAHMQRRDFALNLLYQLIALPIAWHPLLRLTFTRIAETREMICDTLAAEAFAGPESSSRFAQSLLRLASLLLHGTPTPNPHAIGIFEANIFERRLMNLATHHTPPRGIRRLATAAVCTLLGLGACTSALALHTSVVAAAPLTTQQTVDTPATPHIAGGVMAGSLISHVTPVYPPDAKAARLSGVVILHAVIGKDGTIQALTVVSGPEAFQKSALDAVHQWTYKPYLLNGEPTEVDTTITVNYSIKK